MAKFSGVIGFVQTVQDLINDDVWTTKTIERHYCGDIIRSSASFQGSSDGLNDNLNISNNIRLVADHFAYANANNMKYAVINGVKWKINSFTLDEKPRITLNLGGVYNEQQREY